MLNQITVLAKNKYQAKQHDSLVYLHTVHTAYLDGLESWGTIRERILFFYYRKKTAANSGGASIRARMVGCSLTNALKATDSRLYITYKRVAKAMR